MAVTSHTDRYDSDSAHFQNIDNVGDFFFSPHMSLWTSWSSLLGMAEVKPTSEVGTPMRHGYVVLMM